MLLLVLVFQRERVTLWLLPQPCHPTQAHLSDHPSRRGLEGRRLLGLLLEEALGYSLDLGHGAHCLLLLRRHSHYLTRSIPRPRGSRCSQVGQSLGGCRLRVTRVGMGVLWREAASLAQRPDVHRSRLGSSGGLLGGSVTHLLLGDPC